MKKNSKKTTFFKNFDKKINVNLKNYCTIKIGGVAPIMLFPKNQFEVKNIIKICEKNNLQYFILGNGSNVIFPDGEVDIVFVNMARMNKIKFLSQGKVQCEAGVKNMFLCEKLAENNLSGMEWAYGIPASLGGMVKMNAGAFGGQMADIILRVKVLTQGKIVWLTRKNINFSYRKSGLDGVILCVELKLKYNEGVKERAQKFLLQRLQSQPCEPSAGSVFKRSDNLLPAKVIDDAHLKGKRVGGAMVSCKHAGFIVNMGGATCEDVERLIFEILAELKKRNIFFEKEVIFLKKT